MAIVAIIAVAPFVLRSGNDEHKEGSPVEKVGRYSISQLEERYKYIRDHAVSENIHPQLRPIHFSMGDKFAASGTLVLDKNGRPAFVVTANHLFSLTQPGSSIYKCNILNSAGYESAGYLSSVVLDSMRSSQGGIQDIAIGYIGKPQPIARTSKVTVSAEMPFSGEFIVRKVKSKEVISVATGQKLLIIGEAIGKQDGTFFQLALYECMNGESGGGYWSPTENRLYVLSASSLISDGVRKTLEVPDDVKYVTLMSGTSVSW